MSVEGRDTDIPLIISVDDHVVEPPDLWTSRLPARYRDVGPRVERDKAKFSFAGGVFSYEKGVVTHPADLDIELRVMPADGGESRTVVRTFGGQGTFNVNSWAPDNVHFAYMDYPFPE